MRRRLAAALALWAALPAAAQQAEAPAPRPPRDMPAAERPATRPEAPLATVPASPAPAASPATVPAPPEPQPQRGASQGRLIPPDEMPPPAPPPSSAGIAPEGGPEEAGASAAPPGPPVPETLRESDFAHAACRLELRRLGAVYAEAPAITDPAQRDCGIARPLHVTEILPGLVVEGGAMMRCDTARALAHWLRDMVMPAATHLPGAPRLVALAPGTTYQCRGVVGDGASQNLSEHAFGNAIDIAAFGFDDGRRIAVAPPGDRGDLSVAFQNAVQATACLFFTTVLGPGSNAAHEDHLHLDIKARRGGFRLCQ